MREKRKEKGGRQARRGREAPLLPLVGVPTSAPPRFPVVSSPVAAAAPCRAGGRNSKKGDQARAWWGWGFQDLQFPLLPQRSPPGPPPPAAELFALTLCLALDRLLDLEAWPSESSHATLFPSSQPKEAREEGGKGGGRRGRCGYRTAWIALRMQNNIRIM